TGVQTCALPILSFSGFCHRIQCCYYFTNKRQALLLSRYLATWQLIFVHSNTKNRRITPKFAKLADVFHIMKKPIIVIKFGSASITTADGAVDEQIIVEIARQTANLQEHSNVVLVSVGAVTAGKT